MAALLKRPGMAALLVLFLAAAFVYCCGLSPRLVQAYYVDGLYPPVANTLRTLTGWIGISVGDILYVVLIVWLLVSLFRTGLKLKRNPVRQLWLALGIRIVRTVLVLYLVFKISWGLNYSRPPVYQALHIANHDYSPEELARLGAFMVRKTNEAKSAVKKLPELSWEDLNRRAIQAYRLMENKNRLFRYDHPAIKPVTSAWLISMTGVEGYYAPLTGEANVNTAIPTFVLPFVTCHEIAHQTGIAYEDEANLLGFLTAVNSPDPRFRYAACYQALRYILLEMALKSDPNYLKLKTMIHADVLADFKKESDFWEQYNSSMSTYMSATFDRFLKLNDQKKGIKSYQDIVVWLWNLYGPFLAEGRPKA
ncbi:DUF3810 domain-containing protein [Pedobacter sp. SYP-B3415]|uniref:DUF3810 domain-containing protein n=1 Tax=Pedobacter sp. SYP-B3415 TaxID=2496641 RepID=UPI00101D3EBD|nr:DUF3810 domain-containing protein [Pedobacter sp. SYP-B3415]